MERQIPYQLPDFLMSISYWSKCILCELGIISVVTFKSVE